MLRTERTVPNRCGKPSSIARELFTSGLLRPGMTLLDYGCGDGTDVRWLREWSVAARGWDPYHAPDRENLEEAEFVTLLFVLNVIANPAEREEALVNAWELAKRFLVVAVRSQIKNASSMISYKDGYLTQWRTFERSYNAEEFTYYLRAVLGCAGDNFLSSYAAILGKTEGEEDFITPAYQWSDKQAKRELERLKKQRTRLKKQWIPQDYHSLEPYTSKGHRYYRIVSPVADIPHISGDYRTLVYCGNSESEQFKLVAAGFERRDRLVVLDAKIAYLRQRLKHKPSSSELLCPRPIILA